MPKILIFTLKAIKTKAEKERFKQELVKKKTLIQEKSMLLIS